jgi:hypothetical protein
LSSSMSSAGRSRKGERAKSRKARRSDDWNAFFGVGCESCCQPNDWCFGGSAPGPDPLYNSGTHPKHPCWRCGLVCVQTTRRSKTVFTIIYMRPLDFSST